MINLFGFLSLFLLFLAIWKKFHLRAIQIEFSHKLYALRDELRFEAVKNDSVNDSWLFDYYDNTLSKLIASSYSLTIAQLVIFALAHENDARLANFKVDLANALKKDKYFCSLDTQIKNEVKRYVFEQHRISMKYIIVPVVLPFLKIAGFLKNSKAILSNLTVYPEISDSNQRFTLA